MEDLIGLHWKSELGKLGIGCTRQPAPPPTALPRARQAILSAKISNYDTIGSVQQRSKQIAAA